MNPHTILLSLLLLTYPSFSETQKGPLSEEEAVKLLNFPAVTINLERRSVDIDAVVSLNNGMLELVACKSGTKEHESIISTKAKPSHIHASLLLLGAKAGSPGRVAQISKDPPKWQQIPPTGSEIEVFLVLKKNGSEEKEIGIKSFIKRFQKHPKETDKDLSFPTNTFLFSGSKVIEKKNKKPHYICDSTGNIISLTTFGDELLCLPGIHDHSNSNLMWQANEKDLPPLGEKVILRLVPKSPE